MRKDPGMNRPNSDPADAGRPTAIERASMMGAFDPTTLVDPRDEAGITTLGNACDEVVRLDGVEWILKPDVRRTTLASLAGSGRLTETALLSDDKPGDALGSAVRSLVLGTTGNPVLMSRDEIDALYQAAHFVRHAGIEHDFAAIERIMHRW